jgi:hypothetical protein
MAPHGPGRLQLPKPTSGWGHKKRASDRSESLRGISRRTGCRRCQAGSDASAAELGRHIGVGGSDGSRSPLTPPRPVRSPACKRGFSFGRFCCYRLILDYQVPVGIGHDATELKRLKRRYSKRTGETLPNPHIPRPGLGSAASPPLCGAFLLPQRPALTQRRPLVRAAARQLGFP